MESAAVDPGQYPIIIGSVDAHLYLFLLSESVLLRHLYPRHREIHRFAEFDEIQQKYHYHQYDCTEKNGCFYVNLLHKPLLCFPSIYIDDFYTPFVTNSITKFHP